MSINKDDYDSFEGYVDDLEAENADLRTENEKLRGLIAAIKLKSKLFVEGEQVMFRYLGEGDNGSEWEQER